jgi:hypothetical protein
MAGAGAVPAAGAARRAESNSKATLLTRVPAANCKMFGTEASAKVADEACTKNDVGERQAEHKDREKCRSSNQPECAVFQDAGADSICG